MKTMEQFESLINDVGLVIENKITNPEEVKKLHAMLKNDESLPEGIYYKKFTKPEWDPKFAKYIDVEIEYFYTKMEREMIDFQLELLQIQAQQSISRSLGFFQGVAIFSIVITIISLLVALAL